MLPHYSAFKVAEQFRVLEAIAPGRIDLGLGRAPGSDGRTAFALNPLANDAPPSSPTTCATSWPGSPAASCPRATLPHRQGPPAGDTRPRSGCSAAPTTAPRSRPTSACPTPSPGSSPRARRASRRSTSTAALSPSERHPEPHAAICVWALAADTEEEAQHHFTPRARFRLLRDRGIFSAAPVTRGGRRASLHADERRASPTTPGAHLSAPASRSPHASPSSRSAWTSRRWPSSPGPTTRPCATPAIDCSPTRWARLRRTPSCDGPPPVRSGSSTRASGRVHQPGCSIPARRPPAAPAPCAGS